MDELKAPSVVTADVPARPRAARVMGLDGVRGIGCVAVVVGHTSRFYSPTVHDQGMFGMLGLALILFFVLSGFLLFLPYVRRLAAEPSRLRMPNASEYGVHRVMRVFPAYLVIFLICSFVLHDVYLQNPATLDKGTDVGTGMMTDPGELLANLALVQTYFPQYIQTGINPSWSLTLEFAFYLSLPLLGMLLFALRKRLDVGPMVLACLAPAMLIVLGFAGRLAASWVISASGETDFNLLNWGPNWAAVYLRSFLSNADIFAFGMLAAIVFVALEQERLSERLSKRVRLCAFLAFVPATLLSLVLSAKQNVFATTAIGALCGLVILIIVVPLARGQDSTLARLLDNRVFFFMGMVSLSAYLWHYPILVLLGRLGWAAGDSWPGFIRNATVMIVVTLTLAVITYYLVELPAQNVAKRYRKK